MAKPDFLVKLTKFANTKWPTLRVNHGLEALDMRYPCANPEGPVDNSDCPADDPLCNCPCQELKPTEDAPWWDFFEWADNTLEEPTEEELDEALEELKECGLIENVFNEFTPSGTEGDGESWLGCLWKNPKHPSSCNCPCVGENFKHYIEYTRTYATYWSTPKTTPLWRTAQMLLIGSQRSIIVLNGDLSLRPGQLINITNVVPVEGGEEKQKKFTGRWLVTNINHTIQGMSHNMMVSLQRDSTPIDPNVSEETSWFEDLWSFFFG